MKAPLMTRKELEAMGYIHITLMGRKDLSYINKTLNLIESTKGEHLDYNRISLWDWRTYKFLSSGHNDVGKIWGKLQADLFCYSKPHQLLEVCNYWTIYSELLMYRLKHNEHHKPMSETFNKIMMTNAFNVSNYSPHFGTGSFLLYHEQIIEILHTVSNLDIALCERIRRSMEYPDYLPIKDIFMKGVKEYGVYDSKSANRIWSKLMKQSKYTRSFSHNLGVIIMYYRITWLRLHYLKEFKKCYPLEE